ncbi:MAG: carboxypeptidase regulatory-like domain-containing protein [Bacteroidales bacterium]|nr:carboxypeptidase regulatory-like domain-containing protein [Bacteroidales bacterium]
MKKKINRLCLLLFISLLPTVLFISCDKDTNCYLDVIVIDEATKNPLSGVTVELYQNNCDENEYNYRRGVTDAKGNFSTFFEAPGIFSIKATLNLEEGGYRQGNGTVRTVEGETKTATVVLSSHVDY